MENKKELTAPDVSVGADTEQPTSKNTIQKVIFTAIRKFREIYSIYYRAAFYQTSCS